MGALRASSGSRSLNDSLIWNWYGGDALAASHLNTSHVWMAAGAYFERDEVGAGVFASVDAGDSWRLVSPVGWDVYAGSNNST